MNFFERNKKHLIGGLILVAIVVLLFTLGEILLPFVFALFIAYLLNPILLKIQKRIKNRNLATTFFLFGILLLLVGGGFFFGEHVVKDTKRFVSAVEVFTNENKVEINNIKNSVVNLVDDVYQSKTVKGFISKSDTISSEEKEEGAMAAISSVYSMLALSEEELVEPERDSWSAIYMIVYTLAYFVFILYSYEYFEEKYNKYIGGRKTDNKNLEYVWLDYKKVFLSYFKQRGKVVLINMFVFITAFSIMDLPGAIMIGIVAAVLSYASHFHYFSLPLVGIGCWVISVENETNFFIYFGILLAVYILISALDETIYFTKIMKCVNGMNPAIILLSFTLWISIFGSFTGTILALPLTQLILIYFDKVVLYSRK
jgi:predicted PurR-regulated permease PerM